ncbi:acyloxyacyl hydrolase [Pseudooceanicola sp. 502str34]|jgi:hypothetical protein
MDGTLAVLFLVAGLTDMGFNHCGDAGCFARSGEQARLGLSFGDVQYQENSIDNEFYVKYDFPVAYGPFQPIVGASMTMDGDAWVGIGAAWTKNFFADRAYLRLSLMPGLYAQGDGPDLGHAIEFRSGVELGYEARNGVRYGVSYDHRSNADIEEWNPGMETIQFGVSFPLN